jgi:hypothetical protein
VTAVARDKYEREARAANRWEACQRKLRYASVTLAEQGIPSSQYAYLCPECENWHRATRADYKPRVVEGELKALLRRDRELADRWSGKRRRR